MNNFRDLIDLIKYPIITDKATRLIENNQYTFAIDPKATKTQVKASIEYLFKIRVKAINTQNLPQKTRRVGKFLGRKAKYKKAIVTLNQGDSINLFSED